MTFSNIQPKFGKAFGKPATAKRGPEWQFGKMPNLCQVIWQSQILQKPNENDCFLKLGKSLAKPLASQPLQNVGEEQIQRCTPFETLKF